MSSTHGTHDGSRVEAEEAAAHDAHGHGGHGAHDDHDDHGGGHGHGADPNAGVLRGEPPTPAWIGTSIAIALLTILACVLLAIRIG